MPFYKWTEGIKKRVCRYLLQHYLGHFLQEKLHYDQLSVDLFNGAGSVQNVQLDVFAINEIVKKVNAPVEILEGSVKSISVYIPWTNIFKESCVVEVRGVRLVIQPKYTPDADITNMTDSFYTSLKNMTTSMQLAQECLNDPEKPDTGTPTYDGLDVFANAIENILRRIKVKFGDITISFEHIASSSSRGVGLDLNLKHFEYFDEDCDKENETVQQDKNVPIIENVAFSCKQFRVSGVTISIYQLLCNKSSTSIADSKNNVAHDSLMINPVTIVEIFGEQQVKLRVKQNDQLSGPKIEGELYLGDCAVFLIPKQIGLLVEFIDGFSSPSSNDSNYNPDSFPNSVSPVLPHKMSDAKYLGEKYHLNRDYDSENDYNSLELSPPPSATKPKTVQFNNIQSPSQDHWMDDSVASKAYKSAVENFQNCKIEDTLSSKTKRENSVDLNHSEIFRFQIKMVALTLAVLHSDPTDIHNLVKSENSLINENDSSVNIDSHSYLLNLASRYFNDVKKKFEKYSLADLFQNRSLFTNAGSGHDHLRLLAGPLHLECERQSSIQKSVLSLTNAKVSIGNAEVLECLYNGYYSNTNSNLSFDCIELLSFPQLSSTSSKSLFSSTYTGQAIKLDMELLDKSDMYLTKIYLQLADCKSEVDISIIDRLSDLMYSFNIYLKKVPSTNISGTYPPQTSKIVTDQSLFQRILEDENESKKKKIDFYLASSSVHIDFRFPIPDLRPEIERRPWFKRMLRDEILQLDIKDLDCRITVVSSDEANHITMRQKSIQCRFRELSASYSDKNDFKPKPFLCTCQQKHDQSENDYDWPVVRVTFHEFEDANQLYKNDVPSTDNINNFPFETAWDVGNSNTENLFNSCYEPSPIKHPSPFSHRKVVHNCKEMILPGDEEEIQSFIDHATSTSKLDILLNLPSFVVAVPSKSFIESLYNRFNNDLLLWKPVAPQPSVTIANEVKFIPARLDCQSQFFSFKDKPDDQEQFKSAMYGSFMSEDEDDYTTSYFSHNSTSMSKSNDDKVKNQSLLSLTLNISQGSLSLCSDVMINKAPQTGQVFVELRNASLFTVSQYLGNPNLDYVCIQADSCSIYHKIGLVPVPVIENFNSTSDISSHLVSIVYPLQKGIESVFNTRKAKSSSTPKMVTVVLKLELEEKRSMKQCLVASLLTGLTLRHQFLPVGQSFIEQLMDMFDIQDIEVSGYKPPTFLTEAHFHVNDCAIDYKPVQLSTRVIATVSSFALSSNVVAYSPQSTLQIVMDNVSLYLSDNCTTDFIDLRHNFVNVLSVALLEMCLKLKTTQSSTSKAACPELELIVSNSHINMWTCADSCALLAALIRYIAEDGDIDMSDSYNENESKETFSCDGDESDSERSLHFKSPTNTTNLKASYEKHLEDLLAEAAADIADDHLDFAIKKSHSPNLTNSATTAQSEKISDEFILEDDDDFCIIDDFDCESEKNCEPKVEYLLEENESKIVVIDNYFTPVHGRADHLKAPDHFPIPVMRYTVREISCSWFIFGGNDFPEKDSSGKKSKDKKSSEIHTKYPPEYVKRTFHQSDKKQGGINRDYKVLMEFHVNKGRFQHEIYGPDEKFASRTVFTISNFEIHDRLQSSQINKFLYHFHNEASPKQSHANMLLIKALLVRSEKHKDPECRLKVSLQPLRLNIDQDALIFLSEFFTNLGQSVNEEGNFSFDDGSSYGTAASTFAEPKLEVKHRLDAKVIDVDMNGASEPGIVRPLFFKEFVFSPAVPIRLDYRGKRIDIEQGKIAGLLMGLGQLNCSQLKLQKIEHLHGLLGIDKLINFTLNEWAADIRNNQLPSILGGVGPLYSFVQFFQGFRDLVWLPVEQYRRDGRIVRGLQRGTSSFSTSTSMAVLELTNRLVWVVQTTAETACDIVSPADIHKNKQRYLDSWRGLEKQARRRRQPSDFREGFNNAVSVVQHGVSDTAYSIARVAQKEHERKGLTGAVGGVIRHIPLTLMRPVAIASEATSNVLSGMRNQILPDAKREDEDKWRSLQNDP